MDYLTKISDRISELIFERGINNQTLANAVGVNVTSIGRWKRGNKFLHVKDLIKFADYFDCSLDYLTGRSDKMIDYTPKECNYLYERIREVMKECGKSAYRMGKETNIKDSYLSKWKHGQNIHILSLIEIADYLKVSLDYLVGRDR